MSLTTHTLSEKLVMLKSFMGDGSWYVSEKIRIDDFNSKIKFNISPALSLLYTKGYLDRQDSKRVYFGKRKGKKIHRNYYGRWAYKFKDQYLKENYQQIKIEYEQL